MHAQSKRFSMCCAAVLALAACDDEPQDKPAAATAQTAQAPSAAPSMPPGHPPTGQPPAGHPPTGQPPAGHPPTGQVPAGHPPTGQPGQPPSAGGLTWQAPEPLVARTPKSRMRAAEYVVPDDNQAQETTLTVYFFGPGQGGSVQANLDRWIGQVTQPDGSPSKDAAKVEQRRAGTVSITVLDVSGTYNGGMGGGGGPTPGQRMLAAAAEGPQGPVFFKMVGPAETVEQAHGAFLSLLDSLRPAT